MSNRSASPESLDRTQRRVFLTVGFLLGVGLPATIICSVIATRPTLDFARSKPVPHRPIWQTGDVTATQTANSEKQQREVRMLFVIRPSVAQPPSPVAPAGALRPVPDPPPRPPAVALQPGVVRWRHLPAPKIVAMTDDALIASLEKTAVEVDLYAPEYSKSNSFDAITKSIREAARKTTFRKDIVQQRDKALADLKCDERYCKTAHDYEKNLRETQNRFTSDLERHELSISGLLRKADTPNVRNAVQKLSPRVPTVENWMQKRPDLQGLPFLLGTACETEYKAAKTLSTHSQSFRLLTSRRRVRTRSLSDEIVVQQMNPQIVGYVVSKNWTEDDVPALKQILQAGEPNQRSALVAALSKISHRSATEALAERALFETSRDVRYEAIAALQARPAEDYRQTLLKGLQHPWLPAMAHAAEALALLNDRGSIKYLERLLSQPDPTAPFQKPDGKWAVRELVRVNHMRNCYLCHAPSLSRYDTVRGVVPSPNSSLPRVYYRSSVGPFVRAEITYLRQDFSVTHAVEDHKPWSKMQRFDYLVRTRSLTEQEARERIRKRNSKKGLTAYRFAVLYALHKLEASR